MNLGRSSILVKLIFLVLATELSVPALARVITASVVAIDQPYAYNRFGATNPYGMMYALRSDVEPIDVAKPLSACNVRLKSTKRPRPLVLRGNVLDTLSVTFTNYLCATAAGVGGAKPLTRIATMTAVGLTVTGATDAIHNGTSGIAPGTSHTYTWLLEREGTHLIFDNGAPVGGEGDGGSVGLGLFGAINVEPVGSTWYRSQVTSAELAAATDAAGIINHSLFNMLDASNQIVSSELNAIIAGFSEPNDNVEVTSEGNFREFTVIFHDEITAIQASPILNNVQMKGVRDGFAINYGSQGAGGAILANRSGTGPNAACIECAFEEMSLSSWANGDPALLTAFPSDPSNVYHSYLGDPVKIRNLHAGPKETHVFHLHAHQWLAKTDDSDSAYLDSQSIGPRQAFTYEMTYGGSGNRNRTFGDAIFHCHLYPHFAQGMWGLWRIHDVYEDGTRRLPDGALGAGTNPLTGTTSGGTPIPAVVPIPGIAMPPKPIYNAVAVNSRPGYPFFIPGRAGHRAPQPPMDLVNSGGLPRHVIVGGRRTAAAGLSANDFTIQLTSARIQLLEPNGTPLETAAMNYHALPFVASKKPDGTAANFLLNGRPATSGAPFADPCPIGAPQRTYGVTAIQRNLVVNSAGWHDPQARINVLDADAGLHGSTGQATPLFFRANSGECVIFQHTNKVGDKLAADAFQMRVPTDTIGQHIHLVKFDVTSSDGSANGFNYEDGTFASQAIAERIVASRAAPTAADPLGGWAHNPDGSSVNLFQSGLQTTVQRWYADPLLNQNNQDRTLRTVFTHDHFSPSSIQHHGFYSGLLIEPAGSSWLTKAGTPLPGNVGQEAMIVGALDQVTHPDHREFALAVADFAIVYDGANNPVNPPPAREIISTADVGTTLVNYRNNPIPVRMGQISDMRHMFASGTVATDTDIFRAYAGDRVSFRLIQGAQEEQHVFTVHGMRWRRDVSSSNSPYVNAQEIGISEHFEAEAESPQVASNNINYHLYHFGSTDDLWNGAWGHIWVYNDAVYSFGATGIKELPNNRSPASRGNIGLDGCPATAPIRTFNIQVWAARDLLPGGAIVYNPASGPSDPRRILDPSGLLYIRAEDEALLRAGSKAAEPLVIRANAGDCIKVALTNRLIMPVPDHVGDASLPNISQIRVDDFRPSPAVSLHPQLLSYDVRTSDGSQVGGNSFSFVAPGGTVNYTWYAGVLSVQTIAGQRTLVGVPEEFGPINLRSFGDVIKHGAQGLVGALIIEPQGSTYTDPVTSAPVGAGSSAKINLPNGTSFKEFVLVYQDGLNLQTGGVNIPDMRIVDDPEDRGEKAVNYRTEPLWWRLNTTPSIDFNAVSLPANLLLGNISTPILNASPGDDVRIRVVQPDGRARQRSFTLLGHSYPDYGVDRYLAEGASLIAVGKGITARLYGGAKPGSWIYRDGPAHLFSGGVWGRMVVQ